MLETTCPVWRCRTPVVLPKSCMGHLTLKLPKLQRGLYHTATLGKTTPRQTSSIQGTHTCLVISSSISSCTGTAAQHLLCLQASLGSRMAPTSADWLCTCSRSGTMRLMPTWAASSLRPKAAGRSGGAVVCAKPGSRTDGKRPYKVAQKAPDAPMMLAKQFAPATTWLTAAKRWQQRGTGRPTGKEHQRQ